MKLVNMQQILLILLGLTSLSVSNPLTPRASENGACTGANNAPGVCVSTKSCSDAGGSFIDNACPGTPDNIKCCTKPSCGSGGNCRFTSSCSGTTVANLCPGPANFMCCQPSSGGGGGGGGDGGSDIGAKVLAKAKEAKGTPCELTPSQTRRRRTGANRW